MPTGTKLASAAAIVLHRLPVALLIWWLVRPRYGRRAAGVALSAIALNAAANGVVVNTIPGDLLDETIEADVILVGDMFYERELAERTLAFLRRAADAGATVLVGDPSRTYLPREALSRLHEYQVETPRTLEDSDVKPTTVWQLLGKQAAG